MFGDSSQMGTTTEISGRITFSGNGTKLYAAAMLAGNPPAPVLPDVVRHSTKERGDAHGERDGPTVALKPGDGPFAVPQRQKTLTQVPHTAPDTDRHDERPYRD